MRATPVEEHGLPPGTNLAYLQSATGRRSAAIFIPCLFLGGHAARPAASCPSSVTTVGSAGRGGLARARISPHSSPTHRESEIAGRNAVLSRCTVTAFRRRPFGQSITNNPCKEERHRNRRVRRRPHPQLECQPRKIRVPNCISFRYTQAKRNEDSCDVLFILGQWATIIAALPKTEATSPSQGRDLDGSDELPLSVCPIL